MTLVQTSFGGLASSEQVQVGPGDILRVMVSFGYALPQATTVILLARLGANETYSDMGGTKEIQLEGSNTWEGHVDISIPASGERNIDYWLEAELQGYPDTRTRTPGTPISVRGMSEGLDLSGLIGAMAVVMMMGAIMPMMEEV